MTTKRVVLLQCAQRKGAASAFGSLRLYSLSTLTTDQPDWIRGAARSGSSPDRRACGRRQPSECCGIRMPSTWGARRCASCGLPIPGEAPRARGGARRCASCGLPIPGEAPRARGGARRCASCGLPIPGEAPRARGGARRCASCGLPIPGEAPRARRGGLQERCFRRAVPHPLGGFSSRGRGGAPIVSRPEWPEGIGAFNSFVSRTAAFHHHLMRSRNINTAAENEA